MKRKLITAHAMAQAVQFDPQLMLPAYPRFAAELAVVPLDDGLLIGGTDELQILRGRATRVLLPRLLPLLDGTRTLQQLQEALPNISGQAIANAVALLYTRGVLEDASVERDLSCPDEQLLAFFRRHVDTTRVNRSANQAYSRLCERQIALVTLGRHAEETSQLLHRLFAEAGISKLTSLSGTPEELLEQGARLGPNTFAILFAEDEEDTGWMQELDDSYAAQGKVWLRAVWYSQEQLLELGPYFERGETPCYRCFRQTRSSLAGHQPPRSPLAESLQRYQALSLLAIEVVYILSRIAPAVTISGTMRYDLASWTTDRLHFPKIPGCPVCRPLDPASNGMSEQVALEHLSHALIYEDAVAFPARHLLDPKAHQVHYRPENIELTFQGKRYFNASHIPLPPYEALCPLQGETLSCLQKPEAAWPAHTDGECTLQQLTAVLLAGAGIREQGPSKVKRWSSTGGNLGSVELYLVALRVNDLPPGIYFYQAFEHCLATVALVNDLEQIRHFLHTALVLENEPGALLIATTAFHRVSHKYGAFGYRICHLDAGFALGQMCMIGNSLGLETTIPPDWADDTIAAMLGLKDYDEMITALFAINGSKSTSKHIDGKEQAGYESR